MMDGDGEIALRHFESFQAMGLGPDEQAFHSVPVPASRTAPASTDAWVTSRSQGPGQGDIRVPPQPHPQSVQYLPIHRDGPRAPAALDLAPVPAQQPRDFLSVRHFRAALAEENRGLREERQCKRCREREVNAVLVPCGHLYCLDCAGTMSQQQEGRGGSGRCPLCGAGIRLTQRVFY